MWRTVLRLRGAVLTLIALPLKAVANEIRGNDDKYVCTIMGGKDRAESIRIAEWIVRTINASPEAL